MVYKILNIEIAVLLKDSVRQSRHVIIVWNPVVTHECVKYRIGITDIG